MRYITRNLHFYIKKCTICEAPLIHQLLLFPTTPYSCSWVVVVCQELIHGCRDVAMLRECAEEKFRGNFAVSTGLWMYT
ncbi:MAG: hypothetical protein HC903_06890 [Methylacidiphilales bacterium]|nr:hypothetical protein [Candidatus Methylacidiphilales bacterium]